MESTPYVISCQARFYSSATKSKMHHKALISELTWRDLDMQRKAFPGMPHFIIPEDLQTLFRPTRRKDQLKLHVMSVAIIADNEKDFRSFMKNIYAIGAHIETLDEEERAIWPGQGMEAAVSAWRSARVKGAAKIGARISADRKKASTKECIAKIRDRWPSPSKEWSTKALLKEAGLSLNTVKANLGSRLIAQHNERARVKRRATLKSKSDAKYPRMKRATHYIDETKFRRLKDDE